MAHVKESAGVGVGVQRSAANRRSPRTVSGSYPIEAGRAATRPARNYPPSSPELDWNFFLNLFIVEDFLDVLPGKLVRKAHLVGVHEAGIALRVAAT